MSRLTLRTYKGFSWGDEGRSVSLGIVMATTAAKAAATVAAAAAALAALAAAPPNA